MDPRRQSSAPAHPTPSAKVLCREELLGLPEPDHGVCAKVRIADATPWIVETFGVVVSCCRSICFSPAPPGWNLTTNLFDRGGAGDGEVAH